MNNAIPIATMPK